RGQRHGSVAHVPEHVRQIGQRVHVIDLTTLNDAVVDGRGMAGALGPDEQKRLSADGHWPHALLGEVVTGLQIPRLGVTTQRIPVSQGVAYRLTQSTLRQHGKRLYVEPGFKVLQDRYRAALTLGMALIIGEMIDLPLDPEQRFEELDGLARPAGRFQQLRCLDELTSGVHEASNLSDSAITVQ